MTRADDAPARKFGTVALLRRFWGFAHPYRRTIGLGMLMIPLVAAMSTLRPLLLKEAVDVDIASGDVIGLRVTGILFLAAVVAEFLCNGVQIYALQRAGHRTITDLRRVVFRHVMRLPARFYDRHPIGSLLTRTTSDIEALSETLTFGVFTIVTDVVMILAIVGAMFALDVRLSLATLVLAPVLVVLVRVFSAALRRLQLEIRKAQAVQTGYLAEQLTGITVVQLFGREEATARTFERLGLRYLKATKTANIYDALLYALMDGISAMAIALLIYVAAPDVVMAESGVTLGLLFAFVEYLQRVFVPIREFSGKLATLQRAAASLERVYGLLDESTEDRAGPADADVLAGFEGGLHVRDLSFAYREDGPDVLRGIDFDVEPGKVVAVVGRTGSGKSSLGRVLTRTYDGYRGSITLDTAAGPVQLSDVPPDEVRRNLLMVVQDVFLFNDTVAYNVSLGADANADALWDALRATHADDLVRGRGGLDFEIGERGGNLSAGEAQLLALARVAKGAPPLLILDEATANVDSLTEQKVQAAIEGLLQQCTVIVIAHRISTVRKADEILVMSGGAIAERGTHEELIAQAGLYKDLYDHGFEEGDGPEPAGRPAKGPAQGS